jgi:hypothetical protein
MIPRSIAHIAVEGFPVGALTLPENAEELLSLGILCCEGIGDTTSVEIRLS